MNLEIEKIVEQMKEHLSEKPYPWVIALGGPGGCGKSTLAKKLVSYFPDAKILHLDDYKYDRSQRSTGLFGSNPKANNMKLVQSHIQAIREGKNFTRAIYNEVLGKHQIKETFEPGPITFLDGEISTYEEILPLTDYSIYLLPSLKRIVYSRFVRDRQQKHFPFLRALHVFLASNLLDWRKFGQPSIKNCNLVIKI